MERELQSEAERGGACRDPGGEKTIPQGNRGFRDLAENTKRKTNPPCFKSQFAFVQL
jgi:hypothetical protein